MDSIEIRNAYYIKLGEIVGGAGDSIEKGIVRIGWRNIKVEDINDGKWDVILRNIKNDYNSRGKKSGAQQDYNALERFCQATSEDIFITFHKGKMYWCNLHNTLIEKDDISKFRRTKDGWSCKPINDNIKTLHSAEISGQISKTQAFQATLCQYKTNEVEIIRRVINGFPNPDVAKIKEKKEEICQLTTNLIKNLHWKDCEILTDLIFQQSGWHRVSMQGGSLEFEDMEYLDPINNDRYVVQVKSGASLKVFQEYEIKLIDREFRKMFFVVFHPDKSLEHFLNEDKKIEILFGDKLSEMIFDLGLLEWVLKKSF